MSKSRNSWLYVVPILLLTAALAAPFLVSDSLWYDETDTYFLTGTGNFAPISFPTMIFYIAIGNFPPLYYFLTYAWHIITGGGLLFERCFPYFAGLLSMAAMYQAGKHSFNQKVGLLSSLLLGTSAFYLWYFHEVRAYSFLVLVSTLHIWAYTLILKPEYYARRRFRWFYSLALIATIYTHYVGVVSVGVLGLYHLLFERDNKNWLNILRWSINSGLTFTPWIGVMLVSLYNHHIIDWSAKYDEALASIFVAISNGVLIPAMAVLLASLWFWRQDRAVARLWFWLIGFVIFITLGNLYARFIFHPRHLIILFIPALLLVAYLIVRIEKRFPFVAFGILLLWVGAGIFNTANPEFYYSMPTANYRTVPRVTMETSIEVGETCVQPNDALILELWHDANNTGIIHNSTYYYYFQHEPFRYAQLSRMELIDFYFTERENTVDYEIRLDSVVQDAANVWLLAAPEYPIAYELERFESILEERGYTSCGVFIDQSNLMGKVYSLDGEACQQLVQSCAP